MMAFKIALRKIGNTLVPAVGYGAMGISLFYGPTESDEERFKVLDTAYEQGCTHWDTADVYGDSEELIGRWFTRTGKRNEIFLATKFAATPVGNGHRFRGDPEYVKQAVEKSLQRIGVDTIDLVYTHRTDPTVPIELTVSAMAELVKEGKVRYLGLSECSAKDLRRAHAVHPISAIQIKVSPFVLYVFDPQLELLKTARELGVTIVAYAPLGRGLLTGRYKTIDDFHPTDTRISLPKFSPENFPKVLDVVSRIEKIGARHGATSGQVTLAWLLAQGDDFTVIPGTRQIKFLKENFSAADLKLTSDEVEEITKIAEEADIQGERYGPDLLGSVLVESPVLLV